jgi:response regulator NasT
MTRALRIAVAEDERDMREYFQELLPRLGHQVVCAAHDGKELVERCRQQAPDLVIADVRMPGLDGLQAAAEINRARPTPFILVTGHHDDEVLARAGEGPVLAYLVKPVKDVDLKAAITVAMHRFQQMRALQEESAGLRQALEDRKLIERAKGAVMRRLGVDEEDAYRRLRKLSSAHNRKLVEVAQQLVTAEEVFRQLDDL